MRQPIFTHLSRFFLFLSLCICFLLFIQPSLKAQNTCFKTPTSGILGTSGALEKSPWAFFTNPAGLAELPIASAGMGYQNDFHLKELSARTAFTSVPFRPAILSGGFTHSGYQHFNTQQYSFALAKKLAPWLNMGARFNYNHRNQRGRLNAHLITLDAGWQITPSESISIGFYAINPARSQWRLEAMQEELPVLIATSLAYTPVSELQLEAGLVREIEFPTAFSLMVKSQVHPTITIRGTAASAPLRFGLGSSILWQHLQFDMGLTHHETLGFSSAFGLLYQLAGNSKPKNPNK